MGLSIVMLGYLIKEIQHYNSQRTLVLQTTKEKENIMGIQVKMFANGVKAVLQSKGKGRELLQVFDKENCMVAQREILSEVSKRDGSRILSKISIRENKDADGLFEYMRTITEKNGAWHSYRRVTSGDGYSQYMNNCTKLSNGKDIYYYQKLLFDEPIIRDFPLLKKTNLPMPPNAKNIEVMETRSKMWNQWFDFKKSKQREPVKPMMPKSLEKQIAKILEG